jgi:hypothetical protein
LVDVQHAKGASARDENGMVQTTHKNGRRLNDRKENMRAPSASPIRMRTNLSQWAEMGWPPSMYLTHCAQLSFLKHTAHCLLDVNFFLVARILYRNDVQQVL